MSLRQCLKFVAAPALRPRCATAPLLRGARAARQLFPRARCTFARAAAANSSEESSAAGSEEWAGKRLVYGAAATCIYLPTHTAHCSSDSDADDEVRNIGS